MKIVAVTGERFDSPLSQYLLGVLHHELGLTAIVTTSRPPKSSAPRRCLRLLRQRGLMRGLGILGGILPNTLFDRYVVDAVSRQLRMLAQERPLTGVPILHAGRMNSPQSAGVLRAQRADVLVQCGAGLIQPVTFRCARLGMVNLHHGVLPHIRGISSPLWAVRCLRPDWLGVSAHMVDEGIDTGGLLAQGQPAVQTSDGLEQLLLNLHVTGAKVLVHALAALEAGQAPLPPPPGAPSEYRSYLSVWDWHAFWRRLRPFLRLVRGQEEVISVGRYIAYPTYRSIVLPIQPDQAIPSVIQSPYQTISEASNTGPSVQQSLNDQLRSLPSRILTTQD